MPYPSGAVLKLDPLSTDLGEDLLLADWRFSL